MIPLKAPEDVYVYYTPDGTEIDIVAGFGFFKSRNVGAAMRFGFTDPLNLTTEQMRSAPDYTAGYRATNPDGTLVGPLSMRTWLEQAPQRDKQRREYQKCREQRIDAYYEALGELIEQYPIGRMRKRANITVNS